MIGRLPVSIDIPTGAPGVGLGVDHLNAHGAIVTSLVNIEAHLAAVDARLVDIEARLDALEAAP
jgi:hypothetical protein